MQKTAITNREFSKICESSNNLSENTINVSLLKSKKNELKKLKKQRANCVIRFSIGFLLLIVSLSFFAHTANKYEIAQDKTTIKKEAKEAITHAK